MAEIEEALVWQTGVWDKMSDLYLREIDRRFEPVVDQTVKRAQLHPGDAVLDLGTGTGAAALKAADSVGSDGRVVGVDISREMLALARRNADVAGVKNTVFLEGRGEAIPGEDAEFDVILASLSFMYVIDREAAARECARVLKPSGRIVAAVWAGLEEADIVLFQTTAGRYAPPPPAPGVGPGVLADPSEFLKQLETAGIDARVETETILFDFPNFDLAWSVLAGVTTASLPPDRVEEAQAAVREVMWPDKEAPRTFSNTTQFIVGRRV